MKKLVLNLVLFVAPFVLLFLLKEVFYITSGDLGRLGRIPVDREYRNQFKDDFSGKRNYKHITEIEKEIPHQKTRILLVGDSYTTEQGVFGYANQLAEFQDLEVVVFQQTLRRKVAKNPIEILSGLINSDYFEEYKVDYVVLENAERAFLDRCKMDFENFTIPFDSLEIIENNVNKTSSKNLSKKVVEEMNDFMLFYQYNLMYPLDNNAFNSDVYKIPLTTKPFSTGQQLLVYSRDMNPAKLSPSIDRMTDCLDVINQLSEKLSEQNVNLITLIAPDKYDVYYSQIEGPQDYPEPQFYSLYNSMPKNYVDIDCFTILTESVSAKKMDVYFYDDAHWSPFGHKLISQALYTEITNY